MMEPVTKGFQPGCLCLDIETSLEAETRILKVGAWRADTGMSKAFQGFFSAEEACAALDELAQGASFVLGHNIADHDLPVLKKLYPQLALHDLPIIDTLWLSPLAFPQNPYHSLVKDYKLLTDARNDPLRDAQLSFRLFCDQLAAFEQLHRENPREFACYHFLLSATPKAYYHRLFADISSENSPSPEEVRGYFAALTGEKVCSSRLGRLLQEELTDLAAGSGW
jgi:ATP-dependent DNA helicase RecQ